MTESFSQGHAVIIGVGADLPNAIDDATSIANILKDVSRCAYPPQQVQLLTGESATRGHISQVLDQLASATNEEATAVVYFSGHGYRAQTPIVEAYYLMPFGYSLSPPTITNYPQSADAEAIADAFSCLHQIVAASQVPAAQKAVAQQAVEKLDQEAQKGEAADEEELQQ